MKGSFEVPGLNLFFMTGYVAEGEIRRGKPLQAMPVFATLAVPYERP